MFYKMLNKEKPP